MGNFVGIGQKIGQARLGDRELKLTVDKAAPSAFVGFSRSSNSSAVDAFSQAENSADETGA